MNRPNMNHKELLALEVNKGKKIKFFDGMGNEAEGWIQSAGIRFGQFCYEVSKAKNPKSEFNLAGGRWYLVPPFAVIY